VFDSRADSPMPDGFSKRELARPPAPRKLDEWERELQALDVWHRTADYEAVRGAMNLRTTAQAKVLINRGAERFLKDENNALKTRLKAQMTMDLAEFRRLLNEAVERGDLARIPDALKVAERMSKLHGLDAAREDEQVVPNIQIMNVIPGLDESQKQLEAPEGP
jgi:hypothetical protein